jgi:hypothetical protein
MPVFDIIIKPFQVALSSTTYFHIRIEIFIRVKTDILHENGLEIFAILTHTLHFCFLYQYF